MRKFSVIDVNPKNFYIIEPRQTVRRSVPGILYRVKPLTRISHKNRREKSEGAADTDKHRLQDTGSRVLAENCQYVENAFGTAGKRALRDSDEGDTVLPGFGVCTYQQQIS